MKSPLIILLSLILISNIAYAAKGGKSATNGSSKSGLHSITVPADITAEATNSLGAIVSFTVQATNSSGGPVGYNCNPASNNTFPLGITLVNCKTNGNKKNSVTDSFSINVVDNTQPSLNLPGVIQAVSENGDPVTVNFTTSAIDTVDDSVAVDCSHASGSTFPVGSHTINCQATDYSGNQADGNFDIVVSQAVINEPVPPSTTNTSSLTVNWAAPSSRENGDPLEFSEIAGYEIYIIAENTNLDYVLQVENVTSTVLENLVSDTYYLSISTVDNDGLISQPSDMVSLTITNN